MQQNQPTVFVSSTVYDFQDLRQAIRFWLEEYGYKVHLSEMADFPQSPNKNTYDSCIAAIDQCHYFILLIGSRVGGRVDKGQNLSITQMEYQYAYEKLKKSNGAFKLLVFVRKEVWDIRQDIKALEEHMKNVSAQIKELTPEQIKSIAHYPRPYATDAQFIVNFIKEVARTDEMKNACGNTCPLPLGNWVYKFSTFRDIIDACSTVLDLRGSLRHKALCSILQYEVKLNISRLLTVAENKIVPGSYHGREARKNFKGKVGETSNYKGEALIGLGCFLLFYHDIGSKLTFNALREACLSGEFLEYRTASKGYEVGKFHSLLLLLLEESDRLVKLGTIQLYNLGDRITLNSEYKNGEHKNFSFANQELMYAMAFFDSFCHMLVLLRSVYFVLSGNENVLNELPTSPLSPFEAENRAMQKENPTLEQTQVWLENSKPV